MKPTFEDLLLPIVPTKIPNFFAKGDGVQLKFPNAGCTIEGTDGKDGGVSGALIYDPKKEGVAAYGWTTGNCGGDDITKGKLLHPPFNVPQQECHKDGDIDVCGNLYVQAATYPYGEVIYDYEDLFGPNAPIPDEWKKYKLQVMTPYDGECASWASTLPISSAAPPAKFQFSSRSVEVPSVAGNPQGVTYKWNKADCKGDMRSSKPQPLNTRVPEKNENWDIIASIHEKTKTTKPPGGFPLPLIIGISVAVIVLLIVIVMVSRR